MVRFIQKGYTYPTTGVNGCTNRTVAEINQLSDIVNVRISATWKHRTATRKPKPIILVPDPILVLLLNRKLRVRHIREPRHVTALRPPERRLVTVRRRNTTLQSFLPLGTMPLPVLQSSPRELQRSLGVFARRVLAQFSAARRERHGGCLHRRWIVRVVVRVEVEISGGSGFGEFLARWAA